MKALLYRAYFFYYKHFPLRRGKTFLGNVLYKCLGNAVFRVGDHRFLLHPLSLIDRLFLENGAYEEDIFLEIKKALEKEGGILLDIGANFGLFTIKTAKLPKAYVFSFEPSSRELSRLHTNIRLNKLKNVVVFPFALAEKNGTAYLNICDDSNQGMNSLVNSFSNDWKEQVQCFALDNLFDSKLTSEIRIIKMDVEGFEYNVLLGMDNLLNYYSGPIILEVTYYLESKTADYNPDKIYDFLELKGYRSKFGKRYAPQYNDFFTKEPSI